MKHLHVRGTAFLITLLTLVAGLSACGGGGGGSLASTTTIIGSAGDGPITGGLIAVMDANGIAVATTPANPTTGTNAQFNFTVPSGTALPLIITVSGGTDTVTGAAQDFPLRTAITALPANGSVTGNANPLSTLAVASAEAQAGGISTASLTAATNHVLSAVGFGLDTGINPLTTTVSNANVASIVRANEAAAELIRRVSNGNPGLSLANTITSIAQDLTDGVIDGASAVGAAATQVSNTNASHILNQQAQVASELLANHLTVSTTGGVALPGASGANFSTALNAAISTTGHTGNVSTLAPTQAFLDQTRTAINIANTLTGGGNAALNNLLGAVNTLTAGSVPSATQQASLVTQLGAVTFPTPANMTANAAAASAAASAAARDVTAPAAPTVTAPVAGLISVSTPTISGSAEAGTVVTVLNASMSVGTAVTNITGTWTLTSAVLADGTHTLTARATDAAGNISAASTAVTIIVHGNPIVTGAAIDGYVSGASLTVYSDLSLTTQIGSGSTDSGGQFSIQLTVAAVPDPLYIKSVGGTDIDTGMPAPTMMFTVSGGPTTGLNITPMTHAVYGQVLSGATLSAAQNGLLTELGLGSSTELYGNPVVTGSLQAAMFNALSSGTMGSTIPVGNYEMFVITAGDSDIAGSPGAVAGINSIATLLAPAQGLFLTVPFTVAANGDLSGLFTPPGSTTAMIITGKVQGSNIVFNMINPNPVSGQPPLSMIRVVGSIGLNGAVAGNYTEVSGMNTTSPSMSKGVFVGSFIPSTGVNETGLANFVRLFYTPAASGAVIPSGSGLMNIVARDIFLAPGTTTVPRVLWGQAAVTSVDAAAGTASMSNMVMRRDAGSIAENGGATFSATFNAGRYVRSGTPSISTNLLVFEYTLPTTEKIYIATVVGLRRSIFMVVPATGVNAGKITVVGDAYMAKARGLVPKLAAGVTYDVTVASIHFDMPGQLRANAVLGAGRVIDSVGPMLIPASPFDPTSGYIDSTVAPGFPMLAAFQGSVMVMKEDANNDFADNKYDGTLPHDALRVVEFYESGAMAGEEMNGGILSSQPPAPPLTVRNYPATFVGFFHPVGTPSPSFLGRLNFLARAMYGNSNLGFMNAVITGVLDITSAPTTTASGAATLSAADPSGAAVNATMTIDAIGTNYGMYHLHGALSGGGYVDVFWPVGGKKAAYVLSTDVAGTVSEVGEAYMTQ